MKVKSSGWTSVGLLRCTAIHDEATSSRERGRIECHGFESSKEPQFSIVGYANKEVRIADVKCRTIPGKRIECEPRSAEDRERMRRFLIEKRFRT
jgi:hypothetical protein